MLETLFLPKEGSSASSLSTCSQSGCTTPIVLFARQSSLLVWLQQWDGPAVRLQLFLKGLLPPPGGHTPPRGDVIMPLWSGEVRRLRVEGK